MCFVWRFGYKLVWLVDVSRSIWLAASQSNNISFHIILIWIECGSVCQEESQKKWIEAQFFLLLLGSCNTITYNYCDYSLWMGKWRRKLDTRFQQKYFPVWLWLLSIAWKHTSFGRMWWMESSSQSLNKLHDKSPNVPPFTINIQSRSKTRRMVHLFLRTIIIYYFFFSKVKRWWFIVFRIKTTPKN